MKKITVFAALPILLLSVNTGNLFAQKKNKDAVYQNPKASTESRIKDLLSRMTTEEKVGQISTPLGWPMYERKGNSVTISEAFKKTLREEYTGMLWATLRADPWTKKTLLNGLTPELAAKATNAIQKYAMEQTRLGIPLLLAEECPHGHMAIGTTVFPTSLGQASTWNVDLIEKMASAIAEETRLQGSHIGYGPVLDLAREPRWSRVEETYGEDPWLISKMGVAMVKGFQGNDLKSGHNIVSTLKHFAAYGAPEGGHNGGGNSVGLRGLNQFYLPPIKAAIDAGALSVMTAYNSIDGIPCTANPYLLKELLIKQWKFKGFSISDLGSISGLYNNHHVAASAEDAAALAINSGLDADLSGYGFGKSLLRALKNGTVETAVLDTAVSRVLRIKFNMGLFENPYVDPSKAASQVRDSNKINLAAEVARESLILLKNKGSVLPLSKNIKKIAVIGPNADNIYNQLGDYTAPQNETNVITVLKGIENKLGAHAQVTSAKGCAIRDTSSTEIAKAVAVASEADATVVVLGGSSARDFKTEYQESGAANVKLGEEKLSDMESGEGFDRSTLDLLGDQIKLLKALKATGKPIILVLIMGRPLNLNYAAENIDAILNAWYPGQGGGTAIADVLFGDYNPAGRLPISFPKSVGQLPVYYNTLNPQRRPYLEGDAKPLYSFGFGLSYTNFQYSNLILNKSKLKEGGITVEFDLKNTGSLSGDEVPQLYISHQHASVVMPVQELKGFTRVRLNAGETRHVVFNINAEDLKIYSQAMEWVNEKTNLKVMVGPSSDNIVLEGSKMMMW
nr:glycoside hydrolase family 3 N-terminal domain-containing protein [Pedobacter panaciterrae]